MEKNKTVDYLEHFKYYIIDVEKLLQWGDSEHWRHQDFVTLSDKIYEKTKIRLSVSTLKRVWGKVPYESIPSTQTLNALANFINYDSWLAYKKSNESHVSSNHNNFQFFNYILKKIPSVKTTILFVFLVASLIIFLFGYITKKQVLTSKEINSITFSSKPVTFGVPNTVIFKYDVSKEFGKEIQIQQNWDPKKRFKVSSNNHEISSIYYYPGYWKAKLVVDNKIVKEHDIFIKTQNWLTIIENEPIPRYLLINELSKNGTLGPSNQVLEELTSDSSSPKIMSHSYFTDFNSLQGDNFSFEAKFRNLFLNGNGICQNTLISIKCTNGIISIPFSIPGCVGSLSLRCNEIVEKANNNDLSNFGVDYSIWNTVKCIVENKELKIFLNNKLIHRIHYEEPLGKVVGVNFKFKGAGAIDDVILKNQFDKLVYFEDFNSK